MFALMLAACAFAAPQADLGKILVKADSLLEEAKAAYEKARSTSSVPAFVEAGFKLEEARIKYLVLQEIGEGDKQKLASERLRAVNQLNKLINDGRVAVMNPPSAPPSPPPSAPGEPAAPSLAPPTKAAVDVTKRRPVPDAERQKGAEKLARDVFKAEYEKKAPEDRRALVRLLLGQAVRSQEDPAALWVLCQEAENVAVEIADVDGVLEAVALRSENFDVDPLELRQESLAAAAKKVRNADDAGALVDALLALVDDRVQADDYPGADKAASLASAQVKRADDPNLSRRVTARVKEVAEMKALFLSQKRVLERLAGDPEDAPANFEMGKYLCFAKGSWDLGLRFLVKGSDAALKGLAERELAYPADPTARAALADDWVALAEKERSTLRKGRLADHARALYESALVDAAGLLRVKIEKDLERLGPAPGWDSPVDLLRLVDPGRHTVLGRWEMQGRSLVCPTPGPISRIQIPYEPAEEYDVVAVVEFTGGSQTTFYVGLAGPSFQAYAAIDDWKGALTGIAMIDGKRSNENEAKAPGRVLAVGRRSTVQCAVRKDGITVSVDAKRITAFKGSLTRLTNHPLLTVPNRRALFVGATDGSCVISKLQLIPKGRPGNVVR